MFISLSYPLEESAPRCMGVTIETKRIPVNRVTNGDIASTTELHLFTHNGTHMDVPWHIDPNGKRLDELSIEDWVFTSPKVIDIRQRPGHAVERSDIERFFYEGDATDLLLIYSGFSQIRTTDPEKYSTGFPFLTVDAARFLLNQTSVRAIALDFMTPDSPDNLAAGNLPVHHLLLEPPNGNRTILIIEDANIAPIVGKSVERVFAVPLPVPGLDASPVNMFAEV